ncbi:hypothetical protein C8A05DRAFT_39792 [Staphylotrichum tortipilum]|uniref:Uncharacterized protein n=1 Tax=Staphylotrichum tortipilum TaxID=2831512 RepID=A0AAN6MB08_9PEZI|nr:hypothetical protein C8A05DRAFT_39792 [Staphylotrichum longicolle]
MRKAVGCAALSCALSLAEAKALKWSNDNEPRWVPAQETQQTMLAYMPSLGMEPPTPTPAPHAAVTKARLEARNTDGNTCGYIGGTLESSLYCAATGRCVYNSFNMHIGCCDDGTTVCPVWTTCYDSTDRDSFTTNNGLTLWCGDTSYPHCITHLYQDTNLKGYSLLGCAVAAGTGQIWYTPKVSSTSTRRSTSVSTTSSSSSSSTTTSSTSSSSSSTPPPTPNPGPDDNKTPIGAIVGGVVGGLGAIVLIVAVIWLLVRQNNKQKKAAAAAAAAAAAGGAPPPPGPQDPLMSQAPPTAIDPNNPGAQSYYASAAIAAPGFVPVGDPRASIAKPPYGPNYPDAVSSVTTSPPHSPVPLGYQHAQGTPSPPPQQFGNVLPGQYGQQSPQGYSPQQQYGQQQYGQPPQQGYVYGQQQQSPQVGQQGFAAELSAQRGDGELRELA